MSASEPTRFPADPRESPDSPGPTAPRSGLQKPLAELSGIGDQFAGSVAPLGLRYVGEALFYFPRNYTDLTDCRPISQLQVDQLQTVIGQIVDVENRRLRGGRTMLGLLVADQSDQLQALWFNTPYMKDKVATGQRVMLSGKPKRHAGRWQMTHPRMRILEAEQEADLHLVPVYPASAGIPQSAIRRVVGAAVRYGAEAVPEALPEHLRNEYRLLPIADALRYIHRPDTVQQRDDARRRLVFQELFILQLAVALRRELRRTHQKAPSLEVTTKIDARIRRLFPFELTGGQNTAIGEIAADLARGLPMNRLLQGDVGTGKTIVAVYALLACVACGYQGILMAPTEVLARQHFATLGKLLTAGRVNVGLLTGSTKPKERQQLLEDAASGTLDVVIGTQALLDESFSPNKLALVVIDEGHKFGVRQRAFLKQNQLDPHYLVMTATPLPRTLTMTAFGDLDVSTLRDVPPGRKPVTTYLAEPSQREKWWDFLRKKLREGRQAYIVTPLVAEGEAELITPAVGPSKPPGAEETFEELSSHILADFRLGLIHGRLSPAEKEHVMKQFRDGDIQVLVATTAIEVGVDVANATLMTIEGADRFGLSQLHQLRGRICRGTHPGFCVLFCDGQNEAAKARLQEFTQTLDGFDVAEADFRLRGPGDLFGTRQHGLPPLMIADLVRDTAVLAEADTAARAIIAADPGLSEPEHARLRQLVLLKYGQAMELGDVG